MQITYRHPDYIDFVKTDEPGEPLYIRIDETHWFKNTIKGYETITSSETLEEAYNVFEEELFSWIKHD